MNMHDDSFESMEYDANYQFNEDEIFEHGDLLGVDLHKEEYLLDIVI